MFWYKLHLFGDVYLSTGPEAVAEGGCLAGLCWCAVVLRVCMLVGCLPPVLLWACFYFDRPLLPPLLPPRGVCPQACAACSQRFNTRLESCPSPPAPCCLSWRPTTPCVCGLTWRAPVSGWDSHGLIVSCHAGCAWMVVMCLARCPLSLRYFGVNRAAHPFCAEFLNLHKPDASFPHSHFAMLADEERCQVDGRIGGRVVVHMCPMQQMGKQAARRGVCTHAFPHPPVNPARPHDPHLPGLQACD